MRLLYGLVVTLLLLPLAGAQEKAGFAQWWTGFRQAVAKRDAAAVTRGAKFPMQWENGPTREVKSAAEMGARFDFYFTPEIKNIIATRTPADEGRTMRTITWKARGNEYSLYFRAVGDTWAFDGLSEGPP